MAQASTIKGQLSSAGELQAELTSATSELGDVKAKLRLSEGDNEDRPAPLA